MRVSTMFNYLHLINGLHPLIFTHALQTPCHILVGAFVARPGLENILNVLPVPDNLPDPLKFVI